MTSANRLGPKSSDGATHREGRFRRFAQRRPVTAYLVGALGIGLPLLVVPAVAGISIMPFVLPMAYIGFLGSALVVTGLTDGRGGVQQLLSRLSIWSFSVARWAVIVVVALDVGADRRPRLVELPVAWQVETAGSHESNYVDSLPPRKRAASTPRRSPSTWDTTTSASTASVRTATPARLSRSGRRSG